MKRTPSSKRDETAKLAAAFARHMSIKEVSQFFKVSELEAANLIVRGRLLASGSKDKAEAKNL